MKVGCPLGVVGSAAALLVFGGFDQCGVAPNLVSGSDRILLKHGLDRYLREVSSTKKPSTHSAEQHKAKALKSQGKSVLTGLIAGTL